MTTNAFVFAWDINGIESIIPITQYEAWDKANTWKILAGEETERNPLNSILQCLLLRARYNQHRHYEIYSIDCEVGITKEMWEAAWRENPQATADLIRAQGCNIYSDRLDPSKHLIK